MVLPKPQIRVLGFEANARQMFPSRAMLKPTTMVDRVPIHSWSKPKLAQPIGSNAPVMHKVK
jgi:hypothetical protein